MVPIYASLDYRHFWCAEEFEIQLSDICSFNYVWGGIYASYNSHSYMYLGQACLCLPFYLVGYYAKDFLKNTEFRWQTLVLSFSCWIAFFVVFYNGQNVSINMVGQNYPAFI